VSAARPERQRPGSTSPLRRPLQPQVEQLHVGDRSAEPVTDSQSNREPEPQTDSSTDAQTPGATEPVSEVPRYLTLVRKEARVRADQAHALAELRRRVAAQRRNKAEPITDNTLIRLAVDLLMAHADRLAGDTEEELRAALLTDSREQ